jgi:hypothetical protein
MSEEEDIRTAYEVGMHASDEMMRAVVRICKTAGEGKTSVLATLTAFSFTMYRIRSVAKAMDKVMPDFSKLVEEGAKIIDDTDGPKFEEFAEAARKRRGL